LYQKPDSLLRNFRNYFKSSSQSGSLDYSENDNLNN
jgi:hypothetical protein